VLATDLAIFFIWLLLVCVSLVIGSRSKRSSFTVLGIAGLTGLVGTMVGMLVGLYLEGTFLGTGYVATAWSLIGATFGWIVGAAIGLYLTRASPPVSHGEALVLGLIGGLLMLVALLMTQRVIVPSYFQVDSQVYVNRAALSFTHRLIWLDGALAACICLVLMVRSRRWVSRVEPPR
jgi:hypothetical protein